MAVKIYGASDDLIEVEGDIKEEFNFYPSDSSEFVYLAFSDGTLLKISYDSEGMWRISRVFSGSASFQKKEAISPDGDEYSDVVELMDFDIKWVVLGTEAKIQNRRQR